MQEIKKLRRIELMEESMTLSSLLQIFIAVMIINKTSYLPESFRRVHRCKTIEQTTLEPFHNQRYSSSENILSLKTIKSVFI